MEWNVTIDVQHIASGERSRTWVITKLVGFIQTRACVQFMCAAQGYHRDAQWLGGGVGHSVQRRGKEFLTTSR